MHEANKRAAAEVNEKMNAALRAGRQPSTTVNASPQNTAMNRMIRQAANAGQQKQQAAPETPAVTQDTPQVPTTPPGNAGAGYGEHVTYQRRPPGMNDFIRNARYGNSGGGGAYSETGKQL